MNTELGKKSKKWFCKGFFQVDEQCNFLKNHGKCEKTFSWETCNNQSKKELFSVRTILRNNKNFQKMYLPWKWKKQIFMNKSIFLGLSILEISKTVMYEIWCDYLKLKYGEKAKLYYMDTDSFIVYIKTE